MQQAENTVLSEKRKELAVDYGKAKYFPHSIPEGEGCFPLFNGALNPKHTSGGAFLSWGVYFTWTSTSRASPGGYVPCHSSLLTPELLLRKELRHFLTQKATGTKHLEQRRILKPAL